MTAITRIFTHLSRAMFGILVLGAASLTSPAAADDDDGKLAIFVVVESGGTVQDQEAVRTTAHHVLAELTELTSRRANRDAEISIILTSAPSSVAWSGTPRTLQKNPQLAMDSIQFRQTCSDLRLAWDQVGLLQQITMPDRSWLIAIGPQIHAGFPCGDDEISLPQPAPLGLKLTDLALNAERVRLLEVHPDQMEVMVSLMRSSGVLQQAHDGALDFNLMDPSRTHAKRGKLLSDTQ
ncbi:MAG: hypothetical protein AAGI03_05125 [Pseudomonadota bacterium]